MQPTTKVFQSGNSQAVRIPSSFKLDAQEVTIERFGEGLLIRPLRNSWADYFATLSPLEDYPDELPALPDSKPDVDFDS